jgi:hypothetical protein
MIAMASDPPFVGCLIAAIVLVLGAVWISADGGGFAAWVLILCLVALCIAVGFYVGATHPNA